MNESIPFYYEKQVLLVFNKITAQEKPSQTLRGSTIDKAIKTALSGTTIELIGDVNKKTISNKDGSFKIDFIHIASLYFE